MGQSRKLHLGCGQVYRPGFVNIDKYDSSVADEVQDVVDLRDESNTVDAIEASQLIEHFDYVHCKYALSEWFRVLKPGGVLALETPDLERSFKKAVSSALETQKSTQQWIFGLDSPGLQHKSGFTFELLENLLREIGFVRITRERQLTHAYEPGMRVLCEKPLHAEETNLHVLFRKAILRELKTADSYFLIPLEEHIPCILEKFRMWETGKGASIDDALARAAACHPSIALALLAAIRESRPQCGLRNLEDRESLLDSLVGECFVERAFCLWTKSKKARPAQEEFARFLERTASLLCDIMSGRVAKDQGLDHIMGLEPLSVPLLDYSLAMMEAMRYFNLGVKRFHQKEFASAMEAFLMSADINPDNPLTYWNLARAASCLEKDARAVHGFYERASELIADRKTRDRILGEMKIRESGRIDKTMLEPLHWEWYGNL